MAYRVRHWDRHFENHKTRILKTLTWVPVPTDLGSAGYAELVGDHPEGAAHFGFWVAALELAARGTPRGTLTSGSRPHDAKSMSLICRMPQKMIEDALERLVTIGWLETRHHQGTLAPESGTSTAPMRQIEDDETNSETRSEGRSVDRTEDRKPKKGGGSAQATPPQAPSPTQALTDDLRRRAKAQLGIRPEDVT